MTAAAKLIDVLADASRTARREALRDCRDQIYASVKAVLAELDRQGWQAVPKEPTEEMRFAGRDAMEEHTTGLVNSRILAIGYRAMLLTAPKLGTQP